MVHVVFNRPQQHMAIYLPDGTSYAITASGAAWGSPGYGHDAPIAPGHYVFTGQVDYFDPMTNSEGPGQIYVGDLDTQRLSELVKAKHAQERGQLVDIGGIVLPIGGLAKYERSEIMCHAGGSNAPDPTAPIQELCNTYGCARVYNRDWPRLAGDVEKYRGSNTIVYSCIGDPLELSI